MTDNAKHSSLIKTLTKYALIGAALAFVVAYFFGGETPTQVEFNEISRSDAEKLAKSYRNEGTVASYAGAVQEAAPSVVNIFTTKTIVEKRSPLFDDPFFRRFFDKNPSLPPEEHTETSLGSGVIISAEGYILTNNHVIQGATEIQVALRDGRHAEAKIIGLDPEADLAVLHVTLDKLPSITLGQSGVLSVGDVVLAIGNPFGVGQTVTMGIVSATGRDRLGLSTFENFIQTDAAINPGNSGGALVNAYGHLVGINTAIYSQSGGSQGIGFAIPVSYAKDITEQIIKYGHAVRGWLGIEIQDVTPALAESFGLSDNRGVIIAGVLKNGPAATAGLIPGDIILEIDGQEMADGKQVLTTISKALPGTSLKLTVLRRGTKKQLTATTAQRPLPATDKAQSN